MLPDVALLKVFDLHVSEAWIEEWNTLVHVCRRRDVVLGSPRCLDLRIYCGPRTSVREMLGVWPSLPIVVGVYDNRTFDVDIIIAALEHNERIYEFNHLLVPILPMPTCNSGNDGAAVPCTHTPATSLG